MQKEQQVALYIRVSTEEQVFGHSLTAQEAELREDSRQRGKLVYKVYQDAGISGVKENRKGLNALLRDAKAGCFGEVLVWTVSRISRKLSYLLEVVEELKSLDITFRSMSEQFDITTPMGQFALTMMGSVAQMQRESWMESSYIGMEKRVKSGKWCGGMMLGYQIAPDAEDIRGGSKLVIVQNEAVIVNAIFSMYVDGLGYKAITNRLNGERLVGKNGRPFSIHSIRRILSNAAYVGKTRFGDNYYEGNHEPLVSNEVWETVQERMKRHCQPVKKQVNHEYLLSGIIRCPVCNSGMVPKHVRNRRMNGTYHYHYYYVCGAYHNKGSAACKANSIRADDAERKVLTWLQTFLASPFWMVRVMQAIKERYNIETRPLEAERKKVEQYLAGIAKKQTDLLRRYEDDVLDREAFLMQMQRLKAEKEELKDRLAACKPENELPASWSVEEMKAAFRSFSEILIKATANQKRQLIRNMISKIIVNKERHISEIQLQLIPEIGNGNVVEALPLQVAI